MLLGVQNLGSKSEGGGGVNQGRKGTHSTMHTDLVTALLQTHRLFSHQRGCTEPLHNIFSSVQSFSCVQLFVTPWTAGRQASLSNSQSLLKLMSIESVMPSSHPILCRTLPLLPSIFPSIRVFSNKSVLRIRWPQYWSFSFNISPSNEYSGLISFRMDWLDLLGKKKADS